MRWPSGPTATASGQTLKVGYCTNRLQQAAMHWWHPGIHTKPCAFPVFVPQLLAVSPRSTALTCLPAANVHERHVNNLLHLHQTVPSMCAANVCHDCYQQQLP